MISKVAAQAAAHPNSRDLGHSCTISIISASSSHGVHRAGGFHGESGVQRVFLALSGYGLKLNGDVSLSGRRRVSLWFH